jgi:hypothetical protein
MKTTKLELVETPKNTELLDKVIHEHNQIFNRLRDSKNSVEVTRSVTPEEENFKKTRTALNAMLDLNLKKQRGSLHLFETSQEIILVPKNAEESSKVQTLLDALHKFELDVRNLDRVALDTVFSNLSWVQKNVSWVQPDRLITSGEVEVSSTDMNFMNKFVTSSYLSSFTNHNGHSRACKVFNDATENPLILRRSKTRALNGFYDICYLDELDEGEYPFVLRGLNCNFDCDQDPNALSDEDSRELRSRVKSLLNEIEVVNEKFNAYISEVSIPASEFFALLPDETNTELNEFIEIAKQKELRDSQLVRKTVNVGVTLNLEVELDSLGDVEDIKKIISERVQEQLGLNVKIGIDAPCNGDHLKVKETTLAGVDVISNLDEVA